MSKLFAIKAYDQIYGGLQGMIKKEVIEATSLEEAENYGKECSIDVINDWEEILENFENNALFDDIEEDSEEWDEYINSCINEDIAYEVYEITEETNESLENLNEKFYSDEEYFLKKYCKINS